MTTSSDPDEIRAEIEQTRAQLSEDVDRLGESAAPKNVARRQVDRAKEAAVSLKDSITDSVMGKADDVGTGLSDAQGALSDRAASAKDTLSGVPDSTRARTRGNPLAAGLIAFGAGLLISSLIPSSQKEQEAVGRLQEKAEPLKEQISQAASDLAAGLKEPTQQAVDSVKETATQAADNVKAEGSGAAGDVRQQVQDSKENVQNA
jgi:uncharacterized protein YjbJ (UPF0337 family)